MSIPSFNRPNGNNSMVYFPICSLTGAQVRGGKKTPRSIGIAHNFDLLARPLPGSTSVTSMYDLSMGTITPHYDVQKALLDIYRGEIIPKSVRKQKKEVRLLDVGCGTAELTTYITRQIILPYIKTGGSASLVLIDSSFQSLENARLKLEGVAGQIENGDREKLRVYLIHALAEEVDPANTELIGAVPPFCEKFHFATITYGLSWFEDPLLVLQTVAQLLGRKSRMLSIEENPVIVTPGTPFETEMLTSLSAYARRYESIDKIRDLIRDAGFVLARETQNQRRIDNTHDAQGSKAYATLCTVAESTDNTPSQ